jgi:alpha-beta hydrolase superfamily lysophospholipase
MCPAADYVLVASAVWSRSTMGFAERASLWLLTGLWPGISLGTGLVHVKASDNREAIRRLSNDPLTIHDTRLDALRGLVDLMDAAVAAAPSLPASTLMLYGGRDEVIPPEATRAAWQKVPVRVPRGFYPDGYHLLLRDLDRAVPIGDVVAWVRGPTAPLRSGADAAAAQWLTDSRTASARTALPSPRVSG